TPYIAILKTFGIFGSAIHQLLRFKSSNQSSPISIPQHAMSAYEQNKPRSYIIWSKRKQSENSSGYIQISAANIQSLKAIQNILSHSLMTLHTGAGLNRSQTRILTPSEMHFKILNRSKMKRN